MVQGVALGRVGDRQAHDAVGRPLDEQLAARELARVSRVSHRRRGYLRASTQHDPAAERRAAGEALGADARGHAQAPAGEQEAAGRAVQPHAHSRPPARREREDGRAAGVATQQPRTASAAGASGGERLASASRARGRDVRGAAGQATLTVAMPARVAAALALVTEAPTPKASTACPWSEIAYTWRPSGLTAGGPDFGEPGDDVQRASSSLAQPVSASAPVLGVAREADGGVRAEGVDRRAVAADGDVPHAVEPRHALAGVGRFLFPGFPFGVLAVSFLFGLFGGALFAFAFSFFFGFGLGRRRLVVDAVAGVSVEAAPVAGSRGTTSIAAVAFARVGDVQVAAVGAHRELRRALRASSRRRRRRRGRRASGSRVSASGSAAVGVISSIA